MTKELESALTLALQAGRATPAERKRILAALKDGPQHSGETLITTKAAAGILDVSPKTVFRYDRVGLLHAIRRSKRCIRWRKSEVDQLAINGAAI